MALWSFHPHQNAAAITEYRPRRATPSIQVDSPSITTNVVTTTARASEATSNGANTKVSAAPEPRAGLTRTRTGIRTRAIWRGLWRMTLRERSVWLRADSWMPTKFSTALPAMATITSPAKAWLMPRVWMAGRRAWTNQSDTAAAAALVAARVTRARGSDQRLAPAASPPPRRSPRSEPSRLRT